MRLPILLFAMAINNVTKIMKSGILIKGKLSILDLDY